MDQEMDSGRSLGVFDRSASQLEPTDIRTRGSTRPLYPPSGDLARKAAPSEAVDVAAAPARVTYRFRDVLRDPADDPKLTRGAIIGIRRHGLAPCVASPDAELQRQGPPVDAPIGPPFRVRSEPAEGGEGRTVVQAVKTTTAISATKSFMQFSFGFVEDVASQVAGPAMSQCPAGRITSAGHSDYESVRVAPRRSQMFVRAKTASSRSKTVLQPSTFWGGFTRRGNRIAGLLALQSLGA